MGRDTAPQWFHGSDKRLETLKTGSSVTQNLELARAFSHQPTLLGHSDRSVRHNGRTPGYLYVVAEPLGAGDLEPHPHPSNVSRWEWLTNREVRVQLVETTTPREEELFTEDQIARIRERQRELGVGSFFSSEPLYSAQ